MTDETQTDERPCCPNCGSEETDARADFVYHRECQECFFTGPERDFEPNPIPKYSWHIVDHEGVAFEVIEVRHFPATLELRSVMLKRTLTEAQDVKGTLRIAAAKQGRDLAYP